jgi:hypothetical protein
MAIPIYFCGGMMWIYLFDRKEKMIIYEEKARPGKKKKDRLPKKAVRDRTR